MEPDWLLKVVTHVEHGRVREARVLTLDAALESGCADLIEDAAHLANNDRGDGPMHGEAVLRLARRIHGAPPNSTTTAPRAVVMATGVQKTFGHVEVLRDIDLEVHTGDIVGIIGANAVGKTTLLRILGGELWPTGGSVTWPEHGPSLRWRWGRRAHNTCLLPQDLPPWTERVGDGLELAAALARNGADRSYLVARFDLAGYLDYPWHALSGGYRLRVSLAATLLRRPELLLLDEPLAGLDPVSLRAFLSDLVVMVSSFERPLAVVLTGHHIREVESIATRLFILDGGRLHDAQARARTTTAIRRFEVSSRRGAFDWDRFAFVLGARVERRTVDGAIITGGQDLTADQITVLAAKWGLRLSVLTDLSNSALGEMLARPSGAPG